MAVNIFEKYGIKEVANVYFEALEKDAANGIEAGDIVLYLDTLKVSSIETTAENVAAQGGWGNPKLVMWDYGKEINLTLEDALISLESLRFMMGGAIKRSAEEEKVIVSLSEQAKLTTANTLPTLYDHLTHKEMTVAGSYRWINMTKGTRGQFIAEADKKENDERESKAVQGEADDIVRIFWNQEVTKTDAAIEITISPNTFPGTYKVVGDTFIRNTNGKDEAFQFVIGKAKVLSEVTITLEAEGDPSTFEMQLNVLRSENERGENEMMKLIRYSADELFA